MQSKTDRLLREVKKSLAELYGSRLHQLILFGSYARGEQHSKSDVDLLVILNDGQLSTGKEIRSINQALFALVLKFGTIISAYPVSAGRFENEHSFFFNRVRNEGKQL